MKLVQSIGERYLWFDALCIDQNDREHLRRQLEMMGAIYASAKLTIVAADGDATSGIKGLKGISSSSHSLIQRILPLSGDAKVIVSQMANFVGQGSSEYFQRGWTHQEFVLSKRRLIFFKGQVFWECVEGDWYEDLVPEEYPFSILSRPRRYNVNLLDLNFIQGGEQDLDELSNILKNYNRREHSYPEDSLPGIMGLLSMVGRSFDGGFLCGLPEACFDSALMWHTNKEKRTISRPEQV